MMAGEEEGVWKWEADDVTAAATPPSIIPTIELFIHLSAPC